MRKFGLQPGHQRIDTRIRTRCVPRQHPRPGGGGESPGCDQSPAGDVIGDQRFRRDRDPEPCHGRFQQVIQVFETLARA